MLQCEIQRVEGGLQEFELFTVLIVETSELTTFLSVAVSSQPTSWCLGSADVLPRSESRTLRWLISSFSCDSFVAALWFISWRGRFFHPASCFSSAWREFPSVHLWGQSSLCLVVSLWIMAFTNPIISALFVEPQVLDLQDSSVGVYMSWRQWYLSLSVASLPPTPHPPDWVWRQVGRTCWWLVSSSYSWAVFSVYLTFLRHFSVTVLLKK